ncbi:MAG: metalloregulator ArsR/SmtB family transcription factor [Puniceicoccales bacterium]|jgi:ArsR family transcriptional regulator|nr:metalloregulator ArsR/SmtB family transcription factor [Puniceicoccales bacterium]
MSSPWEAIKILADPTRLRILRLVSQEELTVTELQDILEMGQSRISSHLALLRQAEVVTDRRDGKKSYYSLNEDIPVSVQAIITSAFESVNREPEVRADNKSLARVIEKRRHQAEEYFNSVAGKLGKNYCPGRSWEALGHLLFQMVPHIRIADLGAGEGVISQLLARQADFVYCIDNSPRMIEVGSQLAEKHGIQNLEYRLGDIEDVPLDDASVDLVLLSQALHHAQHPEKALREAHRILKTGGKILVLDLKQHSFEKAHELYADQWLGFSENQLCDWMSKTGFQQVQAGVVAREDTEPFFATILASGIKTKSK